MKIPKRVKIGAHTYKVLFRDDLDDENFGVCRPRKLSMFIDETVERTQQEETFIHEILHAIFKQEGMSSPLSYEKEESQVQRLGHALYQVLKENNMLK